MHVFVTGATGFIGSALVPELLAAGHRVTGLSRSGSGVAALRGIGAGAVRGDVNDLDGLRRAVEDVDAVVHTAFGHGATDLQEGSEDDRRVLRVLGERLGSRPLVISSGTALARAAGRPAVETDGPVSSREFPRAATEEAAEELVDRGGHVVVVRLSQVHDTRRFGRISQDVELARREGRAVYVGDGANRVPAVHVSDAVRLYRLALERGRTGVRYHAVAEEGVALREIVEAIGARLGVPVESIGPEDAPQLLGPMSARLAMLDVPASSALTRRELGWTPAGPGLLDDLHAMERDAR